MSDSEKPAILIIAGPTASGKTALSLDLAKELNGEVVNIDSIQVYKHFNIGSAKLPFEERAGITHHLIDILEPTEDFSVARYKFLADTKINEIISRGKLPIFVGGSTLYIKVLLHGLSNQLKSDLKLRNSLELEDIGTLIKELEIKDPALTSKIDLKNKRRVVRAIESLRLNPTAVSHARDNHNFENVDYHALIILPEIERETLYARINQRTEIMLASGLIAETEQIIKDFGEDCPALRSLGYKETVQFLLGEIPQDQLAPLIAQNTRRFAKKQLTFWKNEPNKRDWKILDKAQISELNYDANRTVTNLNLAQVSEDNKVNINRTCIINFKIMIKNQVQIIKL